jgi:subtilisin family serine protease
MKRLAALLLIVGACAIAFIPSRAHAERPVAPPGKLRRNPAAIKNHYIVVFNESVKREQIGEEVEKLARVHGGTVGFTYENALRGFSVEMNEAAAEALSRNPKVDFVEEDAEVQGASTQTGAPWQLDRLDQRHPTLNNFYTYESNGAGVNVYVVDGGIRYTHQEFGGRAAFAYDYEVGGTGLDCNGHGTHVAGLIGGNTYGVAKGVKLWSVRVLNCSNGGSIAGIIAGLDWVTGNHVKPAVANLSFITVAINPLNSTLDIAVKNLIAAGVTTVVAAGNNTGDASLRIPSRVPEAITVAATDQFDNRSPNSNFGSSVDVFAPGVEIVSAHASTDTAVSTRSGTSSAAPVVAGIAARYLSTRPGDAPDAVSQAITNSATAGQVINPGAGSPNLLAYTGITISDNFNDNTRDASKWLAPTGTDFAVAEQNTRLEITPGATATGSGGYTSATTVDLTDARISVEFSSPQLINNFASYLLLYSQSGDWLAFATGGQVFMMRHQVNGVLSETRITYNPSLHRFWRLRHNPADDTINWEISPDGVTWMLQRTIPRPFSITDLRTVLMVSKDTATTPTMTVIFDDLWHESNPTPPVVLADNFDDNVIDPSMWTISDPASSTTIAEQNNRIEMTPQPNTAGYNSLNLAGRFDYRDKTLQVEVEPASQTGGIWTYFGLSLDVNNSFVTSTGMGVLICDATVNGVLDRTQLTWDATMRFWRYRHDIDANTVNFETSADGVTWTTRKTVTAPFALSSLQASFGSGANGAVNPAPGTAVFDNFRLERYRPLFPQSDNFDDNARDAKKWNVNASGSSGFSVVEQNGQLQITPPAANNGSDGYYSATKIDLTDARATVELVQSAGTVSGIETTFKLADPATGQYLFFSVRGTVLVIEGNTGGGTARTSYTYNPAQQRFLRVVHNRMADTMGLAFSPDGKTWTKTALTMGMSFTSVKNWQVQLYTGKSISTATAGTAIFDNLRIERNEGGKAR